jgi:flagellar assembly protein FliH
MAVIKNQFAGGFVKDAIVLDMADLRRQADRMREAARQEADRIIAEAKSMAAALVKSAEAEARARGLEQGTRQGIEQGQRSGHAEALARSQAQLQQLQQGWLAAAQAWDDQRAAMDRDARQAILELGVLFARKVVHRTIDVDVRVVVEQVTEALRYVMRPTDVTIAIHPLDRPVLEEAMPQLAAGLPNLTHVRLVDDEATGRGGCTVTYGQGRIDATAETQLQRLVELLLPGATDQAVVSTSSEAI